jgi:uracil-DNA glycosylase
MNKTLIIGQAPPAVKQGVPYDTTMLYDWLNEIGVSKDEAQELFEFDAVYDKFPGFDSVGGHKKPSREQMDEYWDRALEMKVILADKVILLGNVAKEYFYSKPKSYSCNLEVFEMIHPSKRNSYLYNKDKDKVLNVLRRATNKV